MTSLIKAAIEARSLPDNKQDLLKDILQADGSYVPQEGLIWDFKQTWPFSYSDDFFHGIARLICAFSNTTGGIIVFGVHDKTRVPGCNKVIPNLDRLQQALKQLLSHQPSLLSKRYDTASNEAVDVLLVLPNDAFNLPIRFKRTIGKYKADTIWVRQNSEVVHAEPRHLATLYCQSASVEGDEDSISGGLPPSPATIHRFVGRLNTIDKIFGWLKLSDEPRTFLYGKGGSGKTTIAYEVAKVIKNEGAHIRVCGETRLDNVLFLSAKQQMLNVMDQTAINFLGVDFENERELYEAILTLANWTTEPLHELDIEQLKSELKALFDLTSNFIVIDDVDTLTTKGMEAGFDFLYGVLWRSKRRSKILYTIRNAPSQSLANSIEVPGLEGDDYEEFVNVCAQQFGVPAPHKEFVHAKLAVISERRPLVLESIIALRRSAGNYERSIQLFEEGSGEDVRKYVFQREWNSLPADNYARYVLAVIALYESPLTFADITALTRYEDGRVKDALADIREMFLQVSDVGTETTFQLGALTRAFVFEQSKLLELYPALKERVQKYKKHFYPENPILSRLQNRVEALLQKATRLADGSIGQQAMQLVLDRSLPPKITEDPRFIALHAYVCACQLPPQIDDARRLFGHVFSMKFEPDIDQVKQWFMVERNSGHGLEHCIKISDFVSQGKRYTDDEKIEFLSRKATLLYNRGRSHIHFELDKAIRDIEESISLHLHCHSNNIAKASSKADKSEEYARNTSYFFFDFLINHGRLEDFFKVVSSLVDKARFQFDPLEEPLLRAIQFVKRERGSRSELHKIRGRLDQMRKDIEKKTVWYDRFARERVLDALSQHTFPPIPDKEVPGFSTRR